MGQYLPSLHMHFATLILLMKLHEYLCCLFLWAIFANGHDLEKIICSNYSLNPYVIELKSM